LEGRVTVWPAQGHFGGQSHPEKKLLNYIRYSMLDPNYILMEGRVTVWWAQGHFGAQSHPEKKITELYKVFNAGSKLHTDGGAGDCLTGSGAGIPVGRMAVWKLRWVDK
jgi:hypothetical protein